MKCEITPENVESLEPNQIFGFGSNHSGYHAAGAALTAFNKFGAEWGNGEGLQGQSYAIPTKDYNVRDRLSLDQIKVYVDEFTLHALSHPENHYLMSAIGTGFAGYKVEQIAPIFKECLNMENISLPQSFINVLNNQS